MSGRNERAKGRIPPELFIPIVKCADEYSTYNSPSEAVLALHDTSLFLRSLTAPLLPRTPFLRCPLERCDPGFNHVDNSGPCPNIQYKNNINLDDLLDTVVRLEIDMGALDLTSSFYNRRFSADPPCLYCAVVARHIVHYLDTPSPFPALTCLSISLPYTSKFQRKSDRCKEILSRLFSLPRLRHVMIVDPSRTGIIPLPVIPSNLMVELNLLVEQEEARVEEYLVILDSVRALRSPKVTRAMLEQWAPSLHYLQSAVTEVSLEAIASIPEFKSYRNGFHLEVKHIHPLVAANCSTLTSDFGRQSLKLCFRDPYLKTAELFNAITDIMPRKRHLSIVMDRHPVQGDGSDGSDVDKMLSLIRAVPSLRSIELDINIFFPFLFIKPDTWSQKTALKYARILAPALKSLRRISLCANDDVIPFTVERKASGQVVSVLQMPVQQRPNGRTLGFL